MIQRDIGILSLENESTYTRDIVREAAHRAHQEKRFSEALFLYNLADERDSVISVINIELGNSLSRPTVSAAGGDEQYFQSGKASVSVSAGRDDILRVARSIFDHYGPVNINAKNRQTCEVLLNLKEAMVMYEHEQFDEALRV